MENGGLSKAHSLATWLELLMAILVWVMNGRPRIMLMVTLGPAAMTRLVGDPSRIKYGRWNWNPTNKFLVVTDDTPCWTIPLKVMGD